MKILCEKLGSHPTPVLSVAGGRQIVACMLMLVLATISQNASAEPFEGLFGYTEAPQNREFSAFSDWQSLIEQAEAADFSSLRACEEGRSADCDMQEWQNFLLEIADLDSHEQLEAVNAFANGRSYVIDQDNYGREDYWALPEQFLSKGGDCEDYAVLKFLSLKQLGWPPESLRVVIVQDTKLKQVHAVLAVASEDGIWILDNQVKRVVEDASIKHYAPVYSISETNWSLHFPHS